MTKHLLTLTLLSLGMPATLAMFGVWDWRILAPLFALMFVPNVWRLVSAWRRNPRVFSDLELYKGSWPDAQEL